MDLQQSKYSSFALVNEMMDTVRVVKEFQARHTKEVAAQIARVGRLFLTGEGSSRIFPAKNTIRKALRWGLPLRIACDGARQAAQYDLSKFAVFCASNSGRTKEVVNLARTLNRAKHKNLLGLSANEGTVLAESTKKTFVLSCGWENAVAATKSVVEQALFYESIVRHIANKRFSPKMADLADKVQAALTMQIDPAIVQKVMGAQTIYFAGYNDGVAEELTLKTNEITRRKSDFLEGTYAVHGIEEVMDSRDVVFVVDPIEEEIPKFQEVLEKGVGLTVVAIADRDTPFPTIKVPGAGELNQYVFLCAGWNLLVEVGVTSGINLDKPERARKVGNEVAG